jgi:precorrin-6A/cobalt-precorrin-6A reductase
VAWGFRVLERMKPLRILILGGTGEASALADRLAGDARFAPVLSLAGRTVAPRLPEIPVRVGGFGGGAGLQAYLVETGVQALIVATHPYAVQMRRNAIEAVRALGIKLLLVERAGWVAGAGDDWTEVAGMAEAAAALGQTPRRVLLTVGRQDLAPFAVAPWHDYVIRSVDTPPQEVLPARAKIISARGPFGEAEERRLLRDEGIEVIVTKNSGGAATAGKLIAARALGVCVVMVARPPWPEVAGVCASRVADAAEAWGWLEALHRAQASTERGV